MLRILVLENHFLFFLIISIEINLNLSPVKKKERNGYLTKVTKNAKMKFSHFFFFFQMKEKKINKLKTNEG